MRRATTRRAGLSLAEVLIAIFVLVLGLLGVLSLFPLGAVRMAQAIKDDRCAHLSSNTAALIRSAWIMETDPQNNSGPYPDENPPLPTTNHYYDAFVNATLDVNFSFNPDLNIRPAPPGYAPLNTPLVRSDTPVILPSTTGLDSSYPVYIDPFGWNNSTNLLQTQQYWVGGDPRSIPRRSLRYIQYRPRSLATGLYDTERPAGELKQMIHRFTVLMDDVGYDRNGTPINGAGTTNSGNAGVAGMIGEIQRDGRYTCGVMVRRKRINSATELEMAIVVYSGRTLDSRSEETVYDGAIFQQGSTEVIVPYSGAKPNLRKGSWILDATMRRPTATGLVPEPHGYFYRVISVNDDTPNQLVLEIQEPAVKGTINTDNSVYGLAVVMDGVVEVFPQKSLTPTSRPVP